MKYKKIVVAFSNLESDGKILESALDISDVYGASLTLLHINTEMAGRPSRINRKFEHRYSKEELQEIVDKLNKKAIQVNIEIERTEDIINTTVIYADKCDLLVVGHDNQNAFVTMISDTLDERISNKVKCDVLTVTR